ncbi:polyketide antibiotic transporter [Phycicoccus sp. M110.8]|uniref:ABC transporter permease n=1 Tax=Phycicoccus sp. M110.8 TaxID=3075433 RepID=UPI0028FDAF99|nr:polyketide antibiotic transporter [Phycicoccus sp. M110.8]MDU0312788.1 polyketide antibiotic transporter [Phycicoccus sp. M110.8]
MSTFAGTWPLLRLAWRRDRWVVTASVLALVVTAYSSMVATLDLYPTDAEAAAGARVMADNPSITALYGPLPSLTAPAVGVLKTIMLGSVFTAFLAFALVRRHTRTEEEEGRFELVAGGVVGRRAPLAAAVLLATATVLATGGLSALSLVATGVDPTGSLALGVVEVVAGLVMVGITAVACQLTTTARGAGGLALTILLLAFVVRAVADTSTDGQDLAYASFLGWAERVSPFGDNRLWLVLPAVAALAGLLVVADVLLQRRDLGSGLWAARPGPARAAASLGSPLGLAWRLQRGAVLGWTIGYAVLGLVVGSIARSVDEIASSPGIEEMFRKMSGGQGSLLEVFFGTEIRFLAVGAAAYGITTALRLRSEESGGRAEVTLATNVGRWRWLSSHVLVAVLGSLWLLVVMGLSAGLSGGAVSEVGVAEVLPAALATAPAVLVCVALTVLLFGTVPRWTAAAWGLLAAFVLIGELGPLVDLPGWAMGLSPFDHLGSLPGGDANLVGLTGLLLVALAAGALGYAGFRRRDLVT